MCLIMLAEESVTNADGLRLSEMPPKAKSNQGSSKQVTISKFFAPKAEPRCPNGVEIVTDADDENVSCIHFGVCIYIV
jgi:hypothetical protein